MVVVKGDDAIDALFFCYVDCGCIFSTAAVGSSIAALTW